MTYEDGVRLNKSILDKIDIKPYLKIGEDLRDVMTILEDKYEDTLTADIPELHNDLFCFMDVYDFKLYIEERYSIKVWYWEEEHFQIASE